MKFYCVYILYSARYDKRYIGYTSNLVERMRSHNYLGKKGFMRRYRPWVVVHVEYYDEKREALDREKYLKSGRGRQWISDHVDFEM